MLDIIIISFDLDINICFLEIKLVSMVKEG